ncbi:MAG: DUF3267 domain-containing protein [Bacteroidota bacterium]
MDEKATDRLPQQYAEVWALDLARSWKTAVALNLAAIPLFVGFFWVFQATAKVFRPEFANLRLMKTLETWDLSQPLFLIFLVVFFVVLHELVHGVFFWIYTKEKPVFGLKLLYAFAGAPRFFIPRNQYMVIGLAPLVVLSCVGFILQPFIPIEFLLPLNVALVANASGAVGDVYVVLKLAGFPRSTLVNDTGDKFTAFGEVSTG